MINNVVDGCADYTIALTELDNGGFRVRLWWNGGDVDRIWELSDNVRAWMFASLGAENDRWEQVSVVKFYIYSFSDAALFKLTWC